MFILMCCSHYKSPFLLSDYSLKKLCGIVLMHPSGLSFKAAVHLDFNWCLPFSFKNFLDVELQDLAEWFMIPKQQKHNIISELQHMYQNAGMMHTEWTWNIQKAEVQYTRVAYPNQHQWMWQPAPAWPCSVQTGSFCSLMKMWCCGVPISTDNLSS